MEIKASLEFENKTAKLCQKNKSLGQKIDHKLRILANFPKHPSLRLHKLHSTRIETWSISADKKIRIVFMYQPYGILLINIDTHDQVY